ncbi:LolA family protein [Edaphobacter bradus]|uniref:LolA family protein n=1 Tax=Edaphobacter bradus TaxID=2259016 RepID=UPI0021DF62D3|nr:outer membrane lipoprotein carrier protein LolA [Edaphobacter bradus]
MRPASLLLAVAFVLPCCARLVRAQQADKADPAIVRKVDDHYNHLTSLRARYTEHYSGMGLDRTESGTLLLKKPGRMRWSYDLPAGKLFVLDGKYAWFYTPGDAQVERTPAKQLDDLRSPLRFLLGHTQLKKELDNLAVSPDNNGFLITGVPKGMEQRVRLLTLWVSPAGTINRMRLEEIDGSVTEFAFSAYEENIPTKDADFTFHPPEGLAVVDALPPV